MSKGLRALKRIEDFLKVNTKHWKQDVSYIEEELKALEIIRKRIIDMHDFLVYDTYSSFNQRRTLKGLTPIPKEEYDLLKEVLL